MKKTLSIILSVLFLLSLCACRNNSSQNTKSNESKKPSAAFSQSNDEAETTVESDEVEKNIKISTQPTEDGGLCVFITNNNKSVIDELDLQVKFLDNQNSVVNIAEDGHDMILPGYTVVSMFNDTDVPKSYNKVETEITTEIGVYPSYENHSKDIKINANKGSDCIIVQFTNNSNVEIEELEYIVVLYKNNKIVKATYAQDVYDLKVGKTVTEKEDLYGTKYDNFEVYLNQAHTFGD